MKASIQEKHQKKSKKLTNFIDVIAVEGTRNGAVDASFLKTGKFGVSVLVREVQVAAIALKNKTKKYKKLKKSYKMNGYRRNFKMNL